MLSDETLCFIGAGNMARAIILGLKETSSICPSAITICAPTETHRNKIAQEWPGINSTADNLEGIDRATIIVFAILPETFHEVSNQLQITDLSKKKAIISLAAGITIDTLRGLLKSRTIPIIRAMPNTPCQVLQGVTGLYASDANEEVYQVCGDLFKCLGEICWVPTEDELGTIVGVAGSAPGLFFKLLEALEETASKTSQLSRSELRKLIIATMRGTAEIATRKNDQSFSDLISEVASKGGITAALITDLENNNVPLNFGNTVNLARKLCLQKEQQYAANFQ